MPRLHQLHPSSGKDAEQCLLAALTASFKQIEGYIVKLKHPNVVSIYLKNYISIIKGLGVVGAMRAGVGAGLR